MSEQAPAVPRSRAVIRQAWVERLDRFAASGLCVVAFPRSEGVSCHAFYYWKHKLAAAANSANDAHGLCLWCQRLEAGRYHFPDAPADVSSVEMTAGAFQMILDGIDLSRVHRFKRFASG